MLCEIPFRVVATSDGFLHVSVRVSLSVAAFGLACLVYHIPCVEISKNLMFVKLLKAETASHSC